MRGKTLSSYLCKCGKVRLINIQIFLQFWGVVIFEREFSNIQELFKDFKSIPSILKRHNY